jgi:hypothetical protein
MTLGLFLFCGHGKHSHVSLSLAFITLKFANENMAVGRSFYLLSRRHKESTDMSLSHSFLRF